MRFLWIALGISLVALGFIGLIVPIMPSTVFFVAAAGCFAKSDQRILKWLLRLPMIGPTVRDYRAGLGMPLRAKWIACSMMLVVGVMSAAFALDPVLRWGGVIIIGLGMFYILLGVPTRAREPNSIDR